MPSTIASGSSRVFCWRTSITLAVAGLLVAASAAAAGIDDCNNNGLPDAAEIAEGLVDDCNSNGVPDPCEYAGVSLQAEQAPFGSGSPLVLAVSDPVAALSAVRLSIEVRADLDAIGEFVQARIGGSVVATLWVTGGLACPAKPQAQVVTVPAATFNAGIGGGEIVILLETSAPVGLKDCPSSIAVLSLDYVGDSAAPDCLGNGLWDACDLAADPSLDCDLNGLIDLCEIAGNPSLDCDGNGQIDACEIAADPGLDCNDNNTLDACEFISAAAGFPCDPDCDGDGIHDTCQINADPSLDKNGDGILDACQYARGDLTLDRTVDGADLAFMLGLWGMPNPPIGDLTGDGTIDGADLAELLGAWGETLPLPDCWGTVLEVAPDPAVVADPEWRGRVIATGLPWRVQDNLSGIEMLLVPPGTFMMGCSPSDQYGCQSDEYPVHEVTLTQAFYLGRYEVTQAEWTAVMGSNPSGFQSPSAEVPAEQVPNRPVENVSWNMIQGFEAQTGLRLPTEAEWEYACRAGTQTAFNLAPDGTNADSQLGLLGWYTANSAGQTRPVGQKQANNLGLHDMHGNVWEWVEDRYGSGYYAQSPSIDPPGPTSGTFRVLRGGGLPDISFACRASDRDVRAPGNVDSRNGFRVARTP